MKAIANLISYILHPVFLYTYLYISYWLLFPYPISVNSQGIFLISGILFFNTALLPIIFLILGKRSLLNQSLHERRSTILVVLVVYTLTYIFFPSRFIPEYLQWVLISIVLGMVAAFFISLKLKISLHASGWGGFLGVFLYLLLTYGSVYFYPFMAVVVLAGLVGFSRLFLKAHTNKELYLGYFSGFALTTITLFSAPNL